MCRKPSPTFTSTRSLSNAPAIDGRYCLEYSITFPSISTRVAFTLGCFNTSRITPPSPPPTTNTFSGFDV